MAFLFLIFLLAIAAVYFGKRDWAIALVLAGIFLSLGLFWHHITDVLKINL